MKNKAFLGIDVSKGYADFLLLDQDKQILEDPFQLNDNKAGRLKLSAVGDPELVESVNSALFIISCATGNRIGNFKGI